MDRGEEAAPGRLAEVLARGLLVLMIGCSVSTEDGPSPAAIELRERILAEFEVGLPQLPVPQDNPQSPDKVNLGEALFFDPNLSSCGTVACASCHLPHKGFSDGRRVSAGCGESAGKRNSNTIYNVAYLAHLFWDGRAPSLEEQALAPVTDPVEMSNSWENVVHYLSTGEHPGTGKTFSPAARFYRRYFEKVFGGEITSANAARALACYQRTVITRDAPFDRWIRGDDSALSAMQEKGAMIFFGRGRCSRCHPPPAFTDTDFHNVGVPQNRSGTPGFFPENGQICEGIDENLDPGRAGATIREPTVCADLGRFRTPTLRNVELSAPYMHNGAFPTLEDVLQHYWRTGRGTTTSPTGTLDKEVTTVMLTDFGGHPDDIANLVAFLGALTGTQVAGPARGIAPPKISEPDNRQ